MINKHLASLALDEIQGDIEPFINLLLFVYIRLTAFVIVVTQKLVRQQSKKRQSNCVRKPIAPSLYLISPCPELNQT